MLPARPYKKSHREGTKHRGNQPTSWQRMSQSQQEVSAAGSERGTPSYPSPAYLWWSCTFVFTFDCFPCSVSSSTDRNYPRSKGRGEEWARKNRQWERWGEAGRGLCQVTNGLWGKNLKTGLCFPFDLLIRSDH